MKILIAEDDPIPRRLLQASLTKSGYEVITARDGNEAWEALQAEDAPRLAILDWLMPGMDGVDVCRRVRGRSNAPYVYILLLTSKDRKEDVVAGMDAGADDYLTKPFDPHELQVRLHAGQRILELEAALVRSYDELEQAHRREGETGARIQQTLLLERPPQEFAGMQVAALTIPSQQIDGDFYDFFMHPTPYLDVVVGDVMGKGIAAALLGAAIKSQFLRALSHLLASEQGRLPHPEVIVSRVHEAVTGQFIGLEFFATLCYARFDPTRHEVTFVDCGHTKTIRFRPALGTCETLEGDNMPLGVSEKEVYRQSAVSCQTGDVFCFYSDGVTEAHNAHGEQFGTKRLTGIIEQSGRGNVQELIDAIHSAVVAFTHSEKFADDLTCVVVKIAGEETSPATLEIVSDLAQLANVRAFVRAFCVRHASGSPDEDGLAQLELAVNEALSNIIRHAYPGQADQRIQVEANSSEAGIVVELHHYGRAFDPEAARPPSFDGSRDGGFGVYIIAQSVDAVSYSQDASGRKTIRLVKRLNLTPNPSPERATR